MRKPEVDYRQFRLSRINQPQFSHLKLLLGWVGYFILFVLTEKLISAEKCFPVWCRIDDWIPFCEIFLIQYVFWYALIVFSLGYFLLYHVESFKKLQTYIIITQVVAMVIYIIFPSRQDLRPMEFRGYQYRRVPLAACGVFIRHRFRLVERKECTPSMESLCCSGGDPYLPVHHVHQAAFGGGFLCRHSGLHAGRVSGI